MPMARPSCHDELHKWHTSIISCKLGKDVAFPIFPVTSRTHSFSLHKSLNLNSQWTTLSSTSLFSYTIKNGDHHWLSCLTSFFYQAILSSRFKQSPSLPQSPSSKTSELFLCTLGRCRLGRSSGCCSCGCCLLLQHGPVKSVVILVMQSPEQYAEELSQVHVVWSFIKP